MAAAIMAVLEWPCTMFDKLRDWLEAGMKGE